MYDDDEDEIGRMPHGWWLGPLLVLTLIFWTFVIIGASRWIASTSSHFL